MILFVGNEDIKKEATPKKARSQIQTQQTVDLGMLDRDTTGEPTPVDITVTPAPSLPGSLTYSQGMLQIFLYKH